MLLRVAQLVIAIEQGVLSYPQFSPLISFLRDNKEIHPQQLSQFEDLLCAQLI